MQDNVRTLLIELQEEHKEVKAMVDALRAYQRCPKSTSVDTLYKKSGVTRKHAREFFKLLEKLQFGRFFVGRNGSESRMEWSAPFARVLPPLAGKSKSEAVGGLGVTNGNVRLATCKVSRSKRPLAQLQVPHGSTTEDLKTLGKYIQTHAAELLDLVAR